MNDENSINLYLDERPADTVITIPDYGKQEILKVMSEDPNDIISCGTEPVCDIMPKDLDDETRESVASLVVGYAGLRLVLKIYREKLVRLKGRILKRLLNISNDDIFQKVQYQTIEEFYANFCGLNEGCDSLNDNQKSVIGMIEGCDSATLNKVIFALTKNDFDAFEESLNVAGINYGNASKYAFALVKKNEIWELYRKATGYYDEIFKYIERDFPKTMLKCNGDTITTAHLRASYCFIGRLLNTVNCCMENMSNYDHETVLNVAIETLLESGDSLMKPSTMKIFDYIIGEIKVFSLKNLNKSTTSVAAKKKSGIKDSKSINAKTQCKNSGGCKLCTKCIDNEDVGKIENEIIGDIQAKIDDVECYDVPRKKAAELLHLSTRQLDRWRTDGRIKGIDVGRHVFYRKSDIEEIMGKFE